MSTRKRVIFVLVLVVVVVAVLLFTRHRGPGETLKVAFDAEFLTRPDGYEGLGKHYGFEFSVRPRQMDPGLMYKAVADGAVDVIDGFATDGRIPAYDLRVLKDDKNFFPPYYAAPLVRADTLREHPEVRETLEMLSGKIPSSRMRQLNYEVDEKGRRADEVALEFAIKEGLIDKESQSGDGSAGSVTVGGKHFTEQEILGELMALLLEHHTNLSVSRKLNLGGTMICFNAIRAGDLDFYAEYTGTGLVNILEREVISEPQKAYDLVKEKFEEKFDLIWLKPFGFNNTYTLTMRKEHAAELGIETISDLAAHVNSTKDEGESGE